MKAYEFPANVTIEGKIELPDAILQQLVNKQTASKSNYSCY
jgi:hypothetical protein